MQHASANSVLLLVNALPQYCVLAINKGDVKDTEIEAIMDCIVDSLFSVFVTLGKLVISVTLPNVLCN